MWLTCQLKDARGCDFIERAEGALRAVDIGRRQAVAGSDCLPLADCIDDFAQFEGATPVFGERQRAVLTVVGGG